MPKLQQTIQLFKPMAPLSYYSQILGCVSSR